MTSIRRKARQVAMQILYQFEYDLASNQPAELAAQIRGFFGHFQTPDESQSFCADLVSQAVLHKEEIDQLISSHLKNWKMERLNPIDRAILRVSIAELKYIRDIPSTVTIDEAVELAKSYGSEESYRFINGVMDAIAKE